MQYDYYINYIIGEFKSRLGDIGVRIHAYNRLNYFENDEGGYGGPDADLQFQTSRGISLFQFVNS